MSYCRFSECDVYAYDSSDGGVQFYVADGRKDLDRLCATYNEAYQYAKTLRDTHGLDVPSHALEALKADALEEAARICGSDSAVAELEAENARLRELLAETLMDVHEYAEKYGIESNYDAVNEHLDARMRELGVEV